MVRAKKGKIGRGKGREGAWVYRAAMSVWKPTLGGQGRELALGGRGQNGDRGGKDDAGGREKGKRGRERGLASLPLWRKGGGRGSDAAEGGAGLSLRPLNKVDMHCCRCPQVSVVTYENGIGSLPRFYFCSFQKFLSPTQSSTDLIAAVQQVFAKGAQNIHREEKRNMIEMPSPSLTKEEEKTDAPTSSEERTTETCCFKWTMRRAPYGKTETVFPEEGEDDVTKATIDTTIAHIKIKMPK
uniref:Uncharacterized protein n=1 Tax=Oryza sativa subsp. japonica TaxID=39947 RepID=Q6K3U8_ORYSJ|nr:hypothetical protein [Oryza sativa Japonica Group]